MPNVDFHLREFARQLAVEMLISISVEMSVAVVLWYLVTGSR